MSWSQTSVCPVITDTGYRRRPEGRNKDNLDTTIALTAYATPTDRDIAMISGFNQTPDCRAIRGPQK